MMDTCNARDNSTDDGLCGDPALYCVADAKREFVGCYRACEMHARLIVAAKAYGAIWRLTGSICDTAPVEAVAPDAPVKAPKPKAPKPHIGITASEFAEAFAAMEESK